MKKTRKTMTEYVLMTNYGFGWEEECAYESRREANQECANYNREYRQHGFSGVGSMQFACKVVAKRVPVEQIA